MNKERYPYIGNPFGFKLPDPKPVIHPIINKWEDFTEEDRLILSNIKNIITSHIGECRITIFGSRIKGYWTEKSDYDIIVYAWPDDETQRKLRKYNYDVVVDLGFRETFTEMEKEIEIQ